MPFLLDYFAEGVDGGSVTEAEEGEIAAIMEYVEARFSNMKYILGTALDFTLLAQKLFRDRDAKMLTAFRPDYTRDQLFKDFELVTKRGETKANTLTLVYGTGEQRGREGIRKLEEAVLAFFNAAGRTGYPSAYVYNTGQWQKYLDLLERCFRLSEGGRYRVAAELLSYGLDRFGVSFPVTRDPPRPRLFDAVLSDYPRSAANENGGLAFQGICYAFFKADRPHLSLAALSVRGGSRRVQRFGDIDGYYGLDLELTAEVKDVDITAEIVEKQLGEFAQALVETQASGLAMVRDISDDAKDQLVALSDGRARAITLAEMSDFVTAWDWQKQDAALHAFAHYLAHVELSPSAVLRLLTFVKERDPSHALLAFSPPRATGEADSQGD